MRIDRIVAPAASNLVRNEVKDSGAAAGSWPNATGAASMHATMAPRQMCECRRMAFEGKRAATRRVCRAAQIRRCPSQTNHDLAEEVAAVHCRERRLRVGQVEDLVDDWLDLVLRQERVQRFEVRARPD